MKKQIVSIVLAVSMLVSMLTAFMLPAVAEEGEIVHEAMFTEAAIKVDGELDDEYLMSTPIKSVHKIKDTANTKLSFEAYGLATKEGFYLYVNIIGDTTYVNNNTQHPNSYGGNNRDYLQVYFNMGTEKVGDTPVNSSPSYIGYVVHDYYNQLYFRNDVITGKAKTYTTDPFPGFLSAATKTETGWVSEMYIPWFEGTPALKDISNGNLNTLFRIGIQYNDDYDGNNDYNCAVYDKATTSYWSDYSLMPRVDFIHDFGRLSKTDVYLDGDITIDYNVNIGGGYDSTKMAVRYTITGKDGIQTYTVPGRLVDPEFDTYNFSLAIAPHRMNDTIKVELLHNGKVIHERPTYTVREFCIESLGLTQEESGLSFNQFAAAQNVAISLLNYGAMAQKYKNYDVANLANVGYERDFEDVEIEYDDVVVSKKAAGYDNVELVSYNMFFDGESRFSFKIKADASEANNIVVSVYAGGGKPATYFTLTSENYDAAEGVFEVYSNAIDPSDFDHNYTVRLEYIKDAGTDWESYNIVQSVKCSVNAYLGQLVEQSSNEDLIAFAKAAYILGFYADNMSKA